MYKICCHCGEAKNIDLFNVQKGKKYNRQAFCRECSRKKFKTYYQNNKVKVRMVCQRKRKETRSENYAYVAEYLLYHPCQDCGCKDIRVLEFDHLEHDKKRDGVMRLVNNGASLESVKQEISKCEVRCSNCHTIKTYERRGGSWHNQFIVS